MPKFYLNLKKQLPKDGGNFEIHRDDKNCPWLKELLQGGKDGIDYIYLGQFSTESEAYIMARNYAYRNRYEMYDYIDGCKTCCNYINKKD